MIKVKQNFPTQFSQNPLCTLGCTQKETQQHLLECQFILYKINDKYIRAECKYNDLFGNITDQIKIAKIFSEIFQLRNEIVET